ncbi:hypothetical protein [Symmachiella dynata]|nr:hypothetical protein [Symmachiella dynata]
MQDNATELIRSLTSTAEALTPDKPNLITSCVAMTQQLRSLILSFHATLLRHLKFRSFIRRSIVVFPVCLTIIATLYFVVLGDIYVDTVESTFPYVSSASVDTEIPVLDTRPTNPERYFEDFASFCFGDKSSAMAFLQKHYEHASDADHVSPGSAVHPFLYHRWKVTLRNSSALDGKFISSISVKAKLIEQAPFPWPKVNSEPKVALRAIDFNDEMPEAWRTEDEIPSGSGGDMPSFMLSHLDYGPALNAKVTIRTALGESHNKNVGQIYRWDGQNWVSVPICYVGGPISIWKVAMEKEDSILGPREYPHEHLNVNGVPKSDGNKSLLEWPMYLALGDVEIVGGENKFRHGKYAYEKVVTLERLRELTDVSYKDLVFADLEYSSLSGAKYAITTTARLPGRVLLYARNERLLEFDPRIERHRAGVIETGLAPAAVSFDAILKQFVKPEDSGKGVDQISLDMDIDATQVGFRDTAAQSVMVDRFLNPEGQVCLYVRLFGLKTGRYECRVYVNGGIKKEFVADVLSPDVLRYDTIAAQEPISNAYRLRRRLIGDDE